MNKIKKFLLPAAAGIFLCGCTEEFLSDTEVMGNTTIVGRMAEKSQTRTLNRAELHPAELVVQK